MNELPEEIERKKLIEEKKREDLILKEKETIVSATTTAKLVLLLCFFLFFSGILLKIYFNFDLQLNDKIFGQNLIDEIIFNLSAFFFSLLFFAFLAPLFFALKGIMMAEIIKLNNTELIRLIPLILSAYAGIRLSLILNEDLNKKIDFRKYLKKSLIILFFGLLIAIIIQFYLEKMPKINLI